ncbi:MAG: polyprenyl synthetase family protein [Nitrososphaerales archaeon]
MKVAMLDEIVRLQELLSQNKKEFDKLVLDFLPKSDKNHEISELYGMMRDYPSRGGKGLRGSLCVMWAELLGSSKEDSLVTAAALEMFQNWILIHDDIEDESDLRRGLPALHKKHGVPLSINVGDALHGKMWELLLRNREVLGDEIALQILGEFCTMLNQTTEGQQIELSWTLSGKWDILEEDYLLMVKKKSAWYTCISPARMGVLIASKKDPTKTEELLDRIVKMGSDIGMAFQIVDDVLNLTGSEEKYGKEIFGDIFEGKRTIMLIDLLRKSTPEERKAILATMSKPRKEKSLDEVKKVFQMMKAKGCLDYAKALANDLSNSGLAQYQSISKQIDKSRADNAETLGLLLEYLVKREY